MLSKNLFEEVPVSVGKIKLLQKLYLDNNQIASLPKALGALKYMYKLDMSMNQLDGDTVLASGSDYLVHTLRAITSALPGAHARVWPIKSDYVRLMSLS